MSRTTRPQPSAARHASHQALTAIDDIDAAVAYLHNAHHLGRFCERRDHLEAVSAEANRQAELQADAMVTVIEAVLAGLPLTPAQRDDGRRLARDELRLLDAEQG